MNDIASEFAVASSSGPHAGGPSLIIRLPDLNALSKPSLKLFQSNDEAVALDPEKSTVPKSIRRIDAAVQPASKPAAADATIAVAAPTTTSKWLIAGRSGANAAVATSKILANRIRGKLQSVNWAALAAAIGVVAIKILPSRGQFLAITGVLLLGAALMTRGHISRPNARNSRIEPAVANVNSPVDSGGLGLALPSPGQPVAIPNSAAAPQFDRNVANQGGMSLPSLQPPAGTGNLPTPGPRSQIDQSSPNQKPNWPSNPAQSYEAKRPPESDVRGGRLSDSPIPPIVDPRDRVPYLPPNAPVLAESPAGGSAAPYAGGMSPRVASRETINRPVAPPSGTLQQPAARLDGNIAYPPIRGSYDRAGSSVY